MYGEMFANFSVSTEEISNYKREAYAGDRKGSFVAGLLPAEIPFGFGYKRVIAEIVPA